MPALSRGRRMVAYLIGGYGLSMNSLAYLLVPLRAHEMGASLTMVGLLLAMKSLTETVLSVPTGSLIDRIGPKRAVLIGTAGTALVGGGLLLSNDFALFFLLQMSLGVLRPLGWVGGQLYVNAMRGGTHRTEDTSRFSFWANVGQIVSPLVAGALATAVGSRQAFVAFVVYGAAFFVLTSLLPPIKRVRAAGETAKVSGIRATIDLLRIRSMQSAMLLSFGRLWITSVWVPFYPLFLVNNGTSTVLAGSVISAMAVFSTAVSLRAHRFIARGRPAVMTALALSSGCVGLIVAALVHAAPWFYLPAVLIGFGQGISLPSLISIVGGSVPAGQRGLALSLRSGVNQAAAAGAPIVVAPIIGFAGTPVGFGLAAVLGFGTLWGAAWRDRSDRDDQPGELDAAAPDASRRP